MAMRVRTSIVATIFAGTAFTGVIFRCVPLHDFVEYWSTAHALINRQNAYSISGIMQLQQAMGWQEKEPLVVMSPPQFLPFLLPLGCMHSYVLARLVWLFLSVLMLLFALCTLWSLYDGDKERRWIGIGASALFFPVWHCLAVAQIGPLLLLGIVGFLWFEKRGHLFLAGSALALTTFKPHLFYLFWIALLLWSLQQREVRVLAGAAVSVSALVLVVFKFDPAVLSHYSDLVRSGYVWEYTSGAGGVLRLWFGPQHRWLQFAPMLPGLVALAGYWRRYRTQWEWPHRLPMLLTISILTAAYGWPFDEVVLLVCVVMMAAHSSYEARMRSATMAWLLGNFLTTLVVVLRYGDAGGMTLCAGGILAYLLIELRRRAPYQNARGNHSRNEVAPLLNGRGAQA